MYDTPAYDQPTIAWSNDDVTSAPTWEALEEQVRKIQWHRYAPDEFRDAMSKRAWRWSGTRINVEGTAQEFFAELARAALIIIVND